MRGNDSPSSDSDSVEVVQPDPWAWLEEDSSETLAWQRARDEHAMRVLRGRPGWSELVDRVAARGSAGRAVAPIPAGNHWFHWSATPGGGSRLEVSGPVDGPRRLLWAAASSTQIVSGIFPSPDARWLGIALAQGSDEWNGRLVVVDSGDGEVVDELAFSPFASSLAWLADGSGFYLTGPTPGRAGLGLWFHLIGGRGTEEWAEPVEIPEGTEATPLVSTDGRFVALRIRDNDDRPRFILDRQHLEAGWRPFMDGVKGVWRGVIVEEAFWAVTTVEAPRGRLVRVPLASDGDTSSYQTIVPESEAVLRAVRPAAGPRLVLSEFVDAACRLRVVTPMGTVLATSVLDEPVTLMTDGRAVPWFGAPMGTSSPDTDEVGVVISSFTASSAIAVWNAGHPRPRILHGPAIRLTGTSVQRLHATSSDGTRVPYYLLAPADASSGTGPCVLTGYGGYNVPQLPRYQAWMAVLLDMGISVAVAIQRGGGEFGQDWYDQGRFANQQNSFDDLYGVAEDLIASGVTRAPQLGLYGASNGGLLAAMAAVQRPELFGAVAAIAPLTDLVAAGSDPLTAYILRQDFGDPSGVDDRAELIAASPYHAVSLVRSCPPPILVACPEDDIRCPPWHGRKFAAALSAASEDCDVPILLRVWDGAGHFGGGAVSPAERTAEWLGFLVSHIVSGGH